MVFRAKKLENNITLDIKSWNSHFENSGNPEYINTHIHIETSHFNKIDKNKKQTKKHTKKQRKN